MGAERDERVEWRLFWAWNDADEESWLREMARQGWHLRRAALFRYVFDRGEPADVVYKLDYHVLARKDRGEYLGLFRAAGWEHVGEVASWHYFRTPATAGSDPDIFSDTASRVAKYKRLLLFLLILLPIFVNSLVTLLARPRPVEGGALSAILTGGKVAHVLLVGLWLYAVARIGVHIRRLQRGPRA
ncbi:MAG: DUF2812 domain-containing protein [Acidobacteriota bacterium]